MTTFWRALVGYFLYTAYLDGDDDVVACEGELLLVEFGAGVVLADS